ncbi:MAG: fluoride efflux transporter CrcB [Solirubrobacterales bacterium]
MTFWLTAGVAILGGLGAVGRFIVHSWIVRADRLEFPLATFAVNVAGSFGVGLLAGIGAGHGPRLLLGTGVFGAFTTFSTWMFETERMAVDGQAGGAARNLATGVAAGFGALALGVWLGGMI